MEQLRTDLPEPGSEIRFRGTHAEFLEDMASYGFTSTDMVVFPFEHGPDDQSVRLQTYERIAALKEEHGSSNIVLSGLRPDTEKRYSKYSSAEHALVFIRPSEDPA